jgi:hypothetical protein
MPYPVKSYPVGTRYLVDVLIGPPDSTDPPIGEDKCRIQQCFQFAKPAPPGSVFRTTLGIDGWSETVENEIITPELEAGYEVLMLRFCGSDGSDWNGFYLDMDAPVDMSRKKIKVVWKTH